MIRLLFITSITLLFSSLNAVQLSEEMNCSLFQRKESKFLLITGCARSGTTYISRFLCLSGVDAPHEQVGRDGCISWPMAPNSSYSPWGPASNAYHFDHIFHQVRNPLKTISSVYATEPARSWSFIQKHINQINPEDSHLTKCAKYWLYWNLMAEEKAEWTYRIENLANEIDHMEARLGRPLDRSLLARIPKDVNTRVPGKKQFTWADLQEELDPKLFKKIQTLAQRYGYSIEDKK